MNALELIPLGAALIEEGLVRDGEASLSFREPQSILITRRAAPLARLVSTDLVSLSHNGEPLASDGPERSHEWAQHVAAFRARPEARVVIHAHTPKAIALGLLDRSLPALTSDLYFRLGKRVPLVRYHTPATPELASATTEALRGAPVVLLQNHGVLVTGGSTEEARQRLAAVEKACGIFLDALAVGTPHVLSESEMQALDDLGRSARP